MTGAGHSAIVSQWKQRGFIKSVQRGTITITTPALSNTATIAAVDTGNARLILLGASNNDTGVHPGSIGIRIAFTNSTTITATKQQDNVDTGVVSFEVIEFVPGIIKSVQRGSITLNGVASNTSTITAVNTAKSQMDYFGTNLDNADYLWCRVALTNGTTVTGTRVGATGNISTVGWQVTEFY